MDKISIGILGGGTVGSGVARVLDSNISSIQAQLGAQLEIKAIAVNDLNKTRDEALSSLVLTDDPRTIINDPEISIVVELIGGIETSADLILQAIKNKKHIVTANKALLASRGAEVVAMASEYGVDVFYEGAVGGGIPIIRALRESLSSERIIRIQGIVNGTTNFILSAMTNSGADYAATLQKAMDLGYAEADPTADVGGHDAAQKLSILATLGFRCVVNESDVSVEGIEQVDQVDITLAKKYGYTIKPLAVGEKRGDDISVGVFPAWVSNDSMLAHVNDVFNAVLVESEALGVSMFYGQGAGQLPTGSAVLADIIDMARNIRSQAAGRVPHLAIEDAQMKPGKISSVDDVQSGYYLRFSVKDEPGVLGKIATILGEEGISLRIVDQEIAQDAGSESVPIVALTHSVSTGALTRALKRVDQLATTHAQTRAMRLVVG